MFFKRILNGTGKRELLYCAYLNYCPFLMEDLGVLLNDKGLSFLALEAIFSFIACCRVIIWLRLQQMWLSECTGAIWLADWKVNGDVMLPLLFKRTQWSLKQLFLVFLEFGVEYAGYSSSSFVPINNRLSNFYCFYPNYSCVKFTYSFIFFDEICSKFSKKNLGQSHEGDKARSVTILVLWCMVAFSRGMWFGGLTKVRCLEESSDFWEALSGNFANVVRVNLFLWVK